MKDQVAKNISRYRKEKGLTQEELAKHLTITFQAVSKWERANTLPDISMLPKLSHVLEVSIEKLLGYSYKDKPVTIYEEEYKVPEYYWGVEPSKMCYRVLELMPPTRHFKLLDIGCGEGKDAVFFCKKWL
jgi:tellurite methyltransferase